MTIVTCLLKVRCSLSSRDDWNGAYRWWLVGRRQPRHNWRQYSPGQDLRDCQHTQLHTHHIIRR